MNLNVRGHSRRSLEVRADAIAGMMCMYGHYLKEREPLHEALFHRLPRYTDVFEDFLAQNEQERRQ